MKLIEQLEQSIYRVNTATGSGTGFYDNKHNLIITNYHVIAGFLEVSIENNNKDRFLAKVVYINPHKDIAFLKPANFKTPDFSIQIHHTKQCCAQDSILALGYPYGMPFTVTEGIVSNPKQILNGDTYIQTDAAINPGNSGGPIIDQEGNLVGIATRKFEDADNVGFAIPIPILYEEFEIINNLPLEHLSVSCPSCASIIEKETDYCLNCGAGIEENYFATTPLSELANLLEKSITKMGINPILARNGVEYWNFHKGSANIRLFIHDNNYLCATAPLNKLPKTKLPELYEYLLTQNISPYRLSISENQIFISYIRHLSDLYSTYQEEVLNEIASMAEKSDDLDDFFISEFNAPMTHYSKEV